MTYFDNSQLQKELDKAKAVIFDMNGLIVDDEPYQLKAVNRVFEQFNIKINGDEWFRTYVGKNSFTFFSEIFEKHGIKAGIRSLVDEKNMIYRYLIVDHLRELERPGVRELLNYLTQKLGLATSASIMEMDAILGGLNLLDKFEVKITGQDVTDHKPHPQTYLVTADGLGVSPSDCLVLEDSSFGVDAAFAAGMTCIAVPNRFTEKQNFNKAKYKINNLTKKAIILQ